MDNFLKKTIEYFGIIVYKLLKHINGVQGHSDGLYCCEQWWKQQLITNVTNPKTIKRQTSSCLHVQWCLCVPETKFIT